MRDVTYIDRKDAQEVLEALNGEDRKGNPLITGDAVANALANVLARKLGQVAPPLDLESKRMPDRFERFFNALFELPPENKPLPTDILEERLAQTIADFDEKIANPGKGYEDLVPMWVEDGQDYVFVLGLVQAGDVESALLYFDYLDTASRERIYENLSEGEAHQFGVLRDTPFT